MFPLLQNRPPKLHFLLFLLVRYDASNIELFASTLVSQYLIFPTETELRQFECMHLTNIRSCTFGDELRKELSEVHS